ncbi:hypothetical protein FNV43_RR25092 [Rhamnella rubrinervis]|uniref:LRAT domain-containing protein n=1 Tax=Rhamnella rubrinervis TaxID=2594499 RepID=A0A8K0GPS1_9ROSA|nr:hypothetical protein FNV43_RR25092 [Rhamnella rubrinervis]
MLINGLEKQGVTIGFACLFYYVWGFRNEIVHSGKRMEFFERIEDFTSTVGMESEAGCTEGLKEKWTAPLANWFKANVDADFKEGKTASTLILRNDQGKVIYIASKLGDAANAKEAELKALTRLLKEESWELVWNARSANVAADAIAKFSINSYVCLLFSSFDNIYPILSDCIMDGIRRHQLDNGIYVGDGKVVHLTRAPGLIIFSSSDESSPSHHSGEDRVVCCSTEEFVCGGDLYLYEYGVMTSLFIIKRGGSCTSFTSDPPKDVLHRASILLEKGFGDYHLFENNCEDFAIYCKTSLLRMDGPNRGISGQIQFLVSIIAVVILFPLGSLPSALALVIHGVLYFSLRLMLNKDDVKKVEVENLDDLSNRRTIRMENRRTSRSSLSAGYYIAYTIHTFNVWFWTPTSRILLWIRFGLLYLV